MEHKTKPGWRPWKPPPEKRDRRERWGLRGKTVWDWLPVVGALLIPVVIALGTGGITWQQGRLAEQQAQDDAIQAYLDQMSTLMIDKDLRNTETKSEERLLARARTVTVLSRLVARSHDRETNKEQVVEFLIEAELVHRKHGKIPVISLEETDLSGGVDLDREDLHSANLADANLQDADLAGADLRSANLEEANLRNTNLEDAKLKEALLCRADLQGAEGVTKEQLEEQAKSLKGATMPDGQKYEDNSKDKPCD